MTKKKTPDPGTMSLREWSLRQGIHPQTGYAWFKNGTLPVESSRTGRRIYVICDAEGEPIGKTA